MLNPRSDRLDYGQALMPPDRGYQLDYAVGTTYSLDLQAIMLLPVALYFSRVLDGVPDDTHLDVVEAVTSAAERITVVCQSGKVKVPETYHKLMAYWERSIKQVRMDSPYGSFHPKLWVVRYVKPRAAPHYRLLVSSRNLTYAHDWDVAYSSSGEVGDRAVEANVPLVEFLQSLQIKHPHWHDFITDLPRVRFDVPEGLEFAAFHPIYPLAGDWPKRGNPLGRGNWQDLLVISPFVDDTTVQQLAGKADKLRLMSRRDQLRSLKPDTLAAMLSQRRVYEFSEDIARGEWTEGLAEEGALPPSAQDLHAKLFVGTRSDKHYWYLGSANCTRPAFERNVEFMVELRTTNPRYSPRSICKELSTVADGSRESPVFVPYLPSEVEPQTADDLAQLERAMVHYLTGLTFRGQASLRTGQGPACYDLILSCDLTGVPQAWSDQLQVRVRPLPEKEAPVALQPGVVNTLHQFRGYSLLHLSPYLELSLWQGDQVRTRFVQFMEIELPEDRLHAIFRSIIDSEDKFLQYVTLLLTGDAPVAPLAQSGVRQLGAPTTPGWMSGARYFEELLVAASRYPERLRAVDKLVRRFEGGGEAAEGSIVTEDFMRVWRVYRQYLSTRGQHAGAD